MDTPEHMGFWEERWRPLREEWAIIAAHRHGQIYATSFTWKTFDTELAAQRRYRAETGCGLFGEIIAAEQHGGRRILYEDEHSIAFVPYFARYAYTDNRQ